MNKDEIIAAISDLDIQGVESLNKPEIEKILALKSRAEVAEQTVEEQGELIESLNAKINTADKTPAGKNPVFKLGKEKYELVVPKSRLDGKIIDKSTLKDDSPMLKKLVEIKAAVIKIVK